MKKIFTVSLVAIMAATAANADIASTKYVQDRTGVTKNLTTTAKELTGAVNELKTKLDTVAGNGQGSVADQISSALASYTDTEGMTGAISTAKQELTTEIGKVDAKAGANADAISKLDQTYATDTALTEGLALKEDKDNKVSSFSDTNASGTTYPSTLAVKEYVSSAVGAVNTDLETVTNTLGTLTNTVTTNKSEAETGIQEAKAAAAQALIDAKAYAEAQDAAQTTTITNAYKEADTALETSLKAYAEAQDAAQTTTITTAYQTADTALKTELEGKITSAAGDASKVADDLANYISSNDAAVEKAQTDAVASAKSYTDGEIDKVETAYAAADSALETTLKGYADTAEADAIAAAATDATTKANKALADAQTYADQAELDAIAAAKTAGDNTYQAKSSALSVGAANGAWTDLTAATGYSATGTHSLVLKNGVIQWEAVDYGDNQ